MFDILYCEALVEMSSLKLDNGIMAGNTAFISSKAAAWIDGAT